MKKISVSFCILVALISISSAQNLKRERIFHCLNFGEIELAEELFITETTRGSRTTFEVEVPYREAGLDKTFFRRLNLISKYDGRVLLFTTGNYRVKIDRVFPEEEKYKAFVRLPRFDVHSKDWFCKDYL